MTATIISPNMNLPVPTVGVEIGPDWSNDINACMSAIDSHDHGTGQGVPVTPDGLSINADLPMGGNNLTTVRTVRFTSQSAALSAGTDVGCLYEVSADLYYNDGAGNQVRITQGGSVTGASGTITGLPSGTASASYSGGTFTWRAATNTPATMSTGPLVIGAAAVSPKTVTLGPSGAQASNYALTFPAAVPAANQILQSDGSGNLSWYTNTVGRMPIGSVVASFPNLTGAYSTVATTAADAAGFVLCQGQTIVDATSPMNGQVVPSLISSNFLLGYTAAGNVGGASTVTLTNTQLPSHTHTFTADQTAANTGHTHNISHDHQVLYNAESGGGVSALYGLSTSSASSGTFTNSGTYLVYTAQVIIEGSAGGLYVTRTAGTSTSALYSSGVLNSLGGGAPSVALAGDNIGNTSITGTTAATGTGAAFSILPPYISTVYLMRIK